MQDILNNVASRKFIIGILLIVFGFVFVLVGKLSAQDWITFSLGVGAVYTIVNVSESKKN